MSKIPERLKILRKEKQLTQNQMGEILKIASTTYNGYEKGNSQPSNEMLLSLANFFNVTTDYLLGNIDSKLSPDELLLVSELELTNEELMKKYIITVDHEELPIENILQIINAARALKELAQSMKELEELKDKKVKGK